MESALSFECPSPSVQPALPLTENIEGAPVITPQKFIAELLMLRTRAKELGLPITANIIGRAIEVCERERGGDFLTVKRIERPEVREESPEQPV